MPLRPRTGTDAACAGSDFLRCSPLAPRFPHLARFNRKPHGFQHVVTRKVAPPDRRHRVVHVLVAKPRHRGGNFLGHHRLVLLGQKLLDNFAAKPGELLAHGGARGPPDRRPGLAGNRDVFPGRRRHLRVRADDVHLIAILEFSHQRRMPAIHLAAHAAVANGGVHRIGKIDGRGAARQAL